MSEENQMNDDYFYENYTLSNPHQMEERMTDTCWDQAIYVAYLTDKEGLDYSYVYVGYSDDGAHAFTVVRENEDWYHIEPADGNYLGVHDPYFTLREAVKAFMKSNPKREIIEVKPDINTKPYWNEENISIFEFIYLILYQIK